MVEGKSGLEAAACKLDGRFEGGGTTRGGTARSRGGAQLRLRRHVWARVRCARNHRAANVWRASHRSRAIAMEDVGRAFRIWKSASIVEHLEAQGSAVLDGIRARRVGFNAHPERDGAALSRRRRRVAQKLIEGSSKDFGVESHHVRAGGGFEPNRDVRLGQVLCIIHGLSAQLAQLRRRVDRR